MNAHHPTSHQKTGDGGQRTEPIIRASPDISADARYYVSLIFIVADSLKPISAINYARRANYVRGTNDSRRRNVMRRIFLFFVIS